MQVRRELPGSKLEDIIEDQDAGFELGGEAWTSGREG